MPDVHIRSPALDDAEPKVIGLDAAGLFRFDEVEPLALTSCRMAVYEIRRCAVLHAEALCSTSDLFGERLLGVVAEPQKAG